MRYELNRLMLMASYAHSTIQDYHNDNVELITTALDALPAITGADGLADALRLDDAVTEYYALGAEYRHGPWRASMELAYLDSQANLFLPYIGGYAGLSRRFDDVTLFGIVSHAKTTRDPATVNAPLVPPLLSEYVQRTLNAVQSDQKTVSLGARWDLRTHLALKLQWDRTWVEENKAYLWGRDSEQTPARALNTFTLSMDFVF